MIKSDDLWEKIGIHRALGGVYYRSVIQLIALIFMFLVGAVLLPALAPYPSVQGYRGVVNQMMAMIFTVFDVGIASSLLRFVPEYRIKDLKRSLQYASFFIWFQAITGIIQITIVSIWAIYYLPQTNVAYVIWFILAYSLVQWPSSTGLFRDLLKSFQHHDKAQLIEILQSAIIEVTTQVCCILIFRAWGRAHPMYGELMGITIGWVIGVYLDDIISMVIAGRWFSQILSTISHQELTVWDIIRPIFTKDVVKESLIFGIQNMGAALLSSLQSTLLVWVWVEYIPSYAFYLGITQLVISITFRAGNELNPGIIPAFTESYNNKKYQLSRYYLANGIKYYFFFYVLMTVLNFAVFPKILGAVLEVTGEFFVLAASIIPISVLVWGFDPIRDLFRELIKNTGHVTFYLITTALNVIIDIGFAFIFLFWFDLGWYVLIFYPLPGKIVMLCIYVVFTQKKILPIDFPKWQCLGAPGCASVIYYVISHYFTQYIAPLFLAIDLIGGAVIVLAISFLFMPFFVYGPLYTLFGGYDEHTFRDFVQAVQISGPSRWLLNGSLWLSQRIVAWNPFHLHNAYPINFEGVEKDIAELMQMKDHSMN